MTRWSRPMDLPLQHGPVLTYRGIIVGHDYRYHLAIGEGRASRRGESCSALRFVPADRPGVVWTLVEFADGEKVPVAWSALRGVRERLRGD